MKVAIFSLALVLTLAGASQAQIIPSASIEVTPGSFDRDPGVSSGVLADVVVGDNDPITTKWLAKGTTSLTQIKGFAHTGMLGQTQQQANQGCRDIQIWGWLDTNGNGKADAGDATTNWTMLSELHPYASGGDGSGGNVVGWDVDIPNNDATPISDGSTGDILQTANGGTAITLGPKESWILCVRVVNTINTSNFCRYDPAEQWEDGNLGNAIGSNIDTDKYYDHQGVRSGGPDEGTATLNDTDFVWIYVPKN